MPQSFRLAAQVAEAREALRIAVALEEPALAALDALARFRNPGRVVQTAGLWVDSVEKLFFHRWWKNFRRYKTRSALQARGIHEGIDVAT